MVHLLYHARVQAYYMYKVNGSTNGYKLIHWAAGYNEPFPLIQSSRYPKQDPDIFLFSSCITVFVIISLVAKRNQATFFSLLSYFIGVKTTGKWPNLAYQRYAAIQVLATDPFRLVLNNCTSDAGPDPSLLARLYAMISGEYIWNIIHLTLPIPHLKTQILK